MTTCCTYALILLIHAASGGLASSSLYRGSWMENHWEHIRGKSLVDLSLPGSFHAGSNKQLSSHRLCMGGSSSPLSRMSPTLGEASVAWSIYHEESITEQLEAGIRYLSLSMCSFNFNTNAPQGQLSLQDIVHQENGFTSSVSLNDTVVAIKDFLRRRPYEFLVLSFDHLLSGGKAGNLHTSESERVLLALQAALEEVPPGDVALHLIGWQDYQVRPLESLLEENRRIAIIHQELATPSASFITADKRQLPAEVRQHRVADLLHSAASPVLQDLRKMSKPQRFQHMKVLHIGLQPEAKSLAAHHRRGEHPHSLEEWLQPVLLQVPSIVLEEVKAHKRLRLNAIVAPFSQLAKQWEVAMELMAPYWQLKADEESNFDLAAHDGGAPMQHEWPSQPWREASQGEPKAEQARQLELDEAEGQQGRQAFDLDDSSPVPLLAWLSLILPLAAAMMIMVCVLAAASSVFNDIPLNAASASEAGLSDPKYD